MSNENETLTYEQFVKMLETLPIEERWEEMRKWEFTPSFGCPPYTSKPDTEPRPFIKFDFSLSENEIEK